MRHTLTAEMTLPQPRAEVFAFFSDAGNLERITPPELNFHILTPRPIPMAPGALIDYQLRLWGARFNWRTRISEWAPPDRFVDEQIRGPYKEWVHTHTFEDAPAGGTLIRDRVIYQLPLTPLGDIAYPIIRVQLRRIFRHRQDAIRRLMTGLPDSQ